MAAEFLVNRGADLVIEIPLPVDLTGWTARIFEPDSLIAPHVSVAVQNAAGGIVRVRVEWSDTQPTNRRLGFRLQVSMGDQDDATDEMWVVYQ